MEIKYTIITVDKEGNEQTPGYQTNWPTVTKYLDIWRSGQNPNELTDIRIHQEIKKK